MCEDADVRLSGHPWPRQSARPMSASRGSSRSAALPLCLLQASATSAGPPIVSGRLRPLASVLLTGTGRFIDARPLRSQRHGSLWCREWGRGAGQRPSQRPLGEAEAPQASGVHGRRRYVAYPTMADAVIEAPVGNDRGLGIVEHDARGAIRPAWSLVHLRDDGMASARQDRLCELTLVRITDCARPYTMADARSTLLGLARAEGNKRRARALAVGKIPRQAGGEQHMQRRL